MTACFWRSLYFAWLASPSSFAASVSRSMIWNSQSTKTIGPSAHAAGGARSRISARQAHRHVDDEVDDAVVLGAEAVVARRELVVDAGLEAP